jgi:hypothetical protein
MFLPTSPYVRMVMDAIVVSYALWMISGSTLMMLFYVLNEMKLV